MWKSKPLTAKSAVSPPSDIEVMKGCKVLGRKKVLAEMPLELFVEYANIKEVK